MKAIETVYNGYRFRSRLEARWAVFFDHAGIEYEYEPEGFELEDGTRYLPDFYFPQYDWYAEVKAPRDGVGDDLERASRFVGEQIKALILLGNIPNASETPVYHYRALFYHPLRKEVVAERVCFAPTSAADQEPFTRIGIESWLGVDHEDYANIYTVTHCIKNSLEPVTDRQLAKICHHEHYWWGDAYKLDKESIEILSSYYQQARQARFEHGEKP